MDTDKTTETIIGCGMKVSNTLGAGFLEKVFENALAIELRKTGLNVERQKLFKVTYDGIVVGDYAADMVVNEEVIVELKAAKAIGLVIHLCLSVFICGFRVCSGTN
jgi:GxxExxY protein